MRKLVRGVFVLALGLGFFSSNRVAQAQILDVPLSGWTFSGTWNYPGSTVVNYGYYTYVPVFGGAPIGVVLDVDSSVEPKFTADGITFVLPPYDYSANLRFRFFGTGGFTPGTVMSTLLDSSNFALLQCTSDGAPVYLPTAPAVINASSFYDCTNTSYQSISIKIITIKLSTAGDVPALTDLLNEKGLTLRNGYVIDAYGNQWTVDGSPVTSKNNFCSKCGQPINLANGSFWHQLTDFSVRGRTSDSALEFTRTYVARGLFPTGDFGPNWTYNWETRILPVDRSATPDLFWIDLVGGAWIFKRNEDGSYSNPRGFFGGLTESDTEYSLRLPDGVVYSFSKSASLAPAGRLFAKTDPHGERVSLQYDSNGKLNRIQSPFAGAITFDRNAIGRVTAVHRERDHLDYRYYYDGLGRLALNSDFDGNSTSYGYQSSNPSDPSRDLLTRIIDPIGRRLTNVYDPRTGAVLEQTDFGYATRRFTYGRQANGNPLTTVTEIDGVTYTFLFDSDYHTLAREVNGAWTSYSWNDENQISTETDPLGFITRYEYDEKGNQTAIWRPLDAAPTRIEYDANFQKVVKYLPPVGAPTKFEIDSRTGDFLKSERIGQGSSLSESRVYDSFGNPSKITTPLGSYELGLDPNGFVLTEYDLRNSETRVYDSRGRVASRAFASGRKLIYEWDDRDRLMKVADSNGPTYQWTYDRVGRVSTRTVSDGSMEQSMSFAWDDRDRILSSMDTLGHVTRYEYDPVDANSGGKRVIDRPTAVVDPNGNRVTYAYDSNGRLSKTTDSRGGMTSFDYNLRGDRIRVTDALGRTTTSVYDGNGRLISELRPSVVTDETGRTSTTNEKTDYFYDAAGRKTREERLGVRGEKEVTEYGYDDFDRVVRKVLKRVDSRGKVSVQDDSRFAYAALLDRNLILEAKNGVATIGFQYDSTPPYLPRAFSVRATDPKNPLGLIEGTYSVKRGVENGVESIEDARGEPLFNADYDAAGRMLAIAAGHGPGHGFGSLSFSIVYDGFGRKREIRSSEGIVGTYSYDTEGRTSAISWTEPRLGSSWSRLFGSFFPRKSVSESLDFDPAGNIVGETREFGKLSFTYDSTDELTGVSVEAGDRRPVEKKLSDTFDQTFEYDLAGNRTFASKDGGAATYLNDQILENGSNRFESDADGFGRLSAILSRRGRSQKEMEYRADGKLSGFSLSYDEDWDGDSDDDDAIVTRAEYFYDAFGRRIAKRITQRGWESCPRARGLRKRKLESRPYVYTMSYSSMIDQDRILLARSGTGEISLYLDGPEIDEHLGRVARGKSETYLRDHLGSVLNSPLAGKLRAYGAYGTSLEPLSFRSEERKMEPVVYGFSGREYDPESELYYFRARSYSPSTGRFLQKDPIGFDGQDYNIYRYVSSNPVNRTDASGKSAVAAIIVGGVCSAINAYSHFGTAAETAALGVQISALKSKNIELQNRIDKGCSPNEANKIAMEIYENNIAILELGKVYAKSQANSNITGLSIEAFCLGAAAAAAAVPWF